MANAIIDDSFLKEVDLTEVPPSPNLCPDVASFTKWIRACLRIGGPVFLLMDEANVLSQPHKAGVAELMSQRSQIDLCVKVGSQLHGFSPHSYSDRAVDSVHDYSIIDLESLYTNNQAAYYRRVKRIADHRLKQAGHAKSIGDFLPPSPTDIRDRTKANEIARQRYQALAPGSRPRDETNFVKKYAVAVLFQEVRSKKAGVSYAGFTNVAHLSSGIVRAFLDCCFQMYSREAEKTGAEFVEAITPRTQNEVVMDFSNAFIEEQIIAKIEALELSRDLTGEVARARNELLQLRNLLDSLGRFFRRRLMDTSSREPRIISVSLKDEPGEDLRRILRLAERQAFLHRKWYRSKRGDRNLMCFVLNRRLCPHYNLDLSGFQGRIELPSSTLSLALTDVDGFLQAATPIAESAEVDQLGLFEW